MSKYEVIEYRSVAETYEVEASSEEEAENLVGEGKATLINKYEEHDFYEVSKIQNNLTSPLPYGIIIGRRKEVNIKTEHTGAKNGGGHWGTRKEAKKLSSRIRRINAKSEIKQQLTN